MNTTANVFCRYRVLQLLCHSVEGAHDIKCSQKQLALTEILLM